MPACRRSRSRSGSSLIGSADHDLRLVQHDGAFGDALLADEAADEEGKAVRARASIAPGPTKAPSSAISAMTMATTSRA